MPPTNLPQSTGLTITNPLILYRALLATKAIDPDPAQHRIALHLQKLYLRLKDYKPQSEYAARLKAISRAIHDGQNDEDGRMIAVPGHPLRNNPLFAHLFRRKERQDTLAMTRVLTSHEAAMHLDSPQGILLHGEVKLYLLTPFFQLGGVLIASSNRMPEELEKASGMDYTVPGRGGLVKNWLGLAKPHKLDMFSSGNEFSGFVGVLKARCEIWDMGKGGRDWRRREIEDIDEEDAEMAEVMREEMIEGFTGIGKLSPGDIGLAYEQSGHERDDDYITMASTFHTFVIDAIPILTLLQKNEARRLITLLDALYEARCKLIIRAAVGPDSLFFPETQLSPSSNPDSESIENPQDAVYPETLSEIYQDQTSPFRPNISTYTDTPSIKTGYDPDEDADFNPTPGAGHEIGQKRGLDFGGQKALQAKMRGSRIRELRVGCGRCVERDGMREVERAKVGGDH
ncbi:hypothetical protein DID88_001907 [Monilinia fructigena]|uniref:Uncharacterized protein n=1 Tax=Monilinia fructigena TaxID=38457 RepID=A0A395IWA9_9HELO|nr:hypothetical protein DID88_001907 [Monilinia fructigena]